MGLRRIHVWLYCTLTVISASPDDPASKLAIPPENEADLSGFAILGSSKVKWAVFH